jgi:hypothetical protein
MRNSARFIVTALLVAALTQDAVANVDILRRSDALCRLHGSIALRRRLVIRFVDALAALLRGTGDDWHRAIDAAQYGGVPVSRIEEILTEAVGAGLMERLVGNPTLVKLTPAGLIAAHGGRSLR